jgi:hypothetical protein
MCSIRCLDGDTNNDMFGAFLVRSQIPTLKSLSEGMHLAEEICALFNLKKIK